MRPFRSHATRWPISVMCILSVCLTLLTTVAFSPSVCAQASISQVAVIDFRNASNMPGQMFGRMATDAVVLELIRSGKFGVVPSDSLEATMKQLGFDSNMNQSAMIRLGQESEASSVVSGEVISIKINKDKKIAEARIAVKLLDVASGEIVNGAVASGVSQPRIGFTADEDKMLVQAIQDAARSAVEMMVAYTIPEATVLNSVGTDAVLLNKGSQEGLEPGMEMIVLRRMDGGQEEVVGRIKITKVSDSDSVGSIIRAPRGVKSEDRVRAVYSMPDYSSSDRVSAPKRTGGRKSITSGSKLLWGLVALIGIASLMSSGSDSGGDVPTVAAMAARTPEVNGAISANETILLVWNGLEGVNKDDVMQYHIWRDNHGFIFDMESGSGINVGPVTVKGPAKNQWSSPALGSFDHWALDFSASRLPYDLMYPTVDQAQGTFEVESMFGVTLYEPHDYYVSAMYRRYHPADGTWTYHETDYTYAGKATIVSIPECVMPDQSTDLPLDNITFEWEPSQGADLYRIEVSTVPTFDRDKTFCKDIYHVEAMNNRITLTNVLDRCPEFYRKVTSGQTLYWRIGARNSADQPGPYPAGMSAACAAASGPKNTRFFYCDVPSQFTIDTPPGGTPGDGGDGGDGGDDDGDLPPFPNI